VGGKYEEGYRCAAHITKFFVSSIFAVLVTLMGPLSTYTVNPGARVNDML